MTSDLRELTTTDLERLGSRLLNKGKHKFLGVFPAHSLPYGRKKRILKNVSLIANSMTSSGPGLHWLCFYFSEAGNGHFFDSYGKKPSAYHRDWKQYLNVHSIRWTYNTKIVQKGWKPTCGYHCLYYLYHKANYPDSSNAKILINHSDDNVIKWFKNKI